MQISGIVNKFKDKSINIIIGINQWGDDAQMYVRDTVQLAVHPDRFLIYKSTGSEPSTFECRIGRPQTIVYELAKMIAKSNRKL